MLFIAIIDMLSKQSLQTNIIITTPKRVNITCIWSKIFLAEELDSYKLPLFASFCSEIPILFGIYDKHTHTLNHTMCSINLIFNSENSNHLDLKYPFSKIRAWNDELCVMLLEIIPSCVLFLISGYVT